MAVKTTSTQAPKKDTQGATKKAPVKSTTAAKSSKPAVKPAAKPAAKTTTKAATKPAAKVAAKPVITTKASAPATGKTAYHVSKRDNDGREWKVFIQGSDKVIKLFDTQAEALDYAKQLADNKNDGSSVVLHGLNGKIRKI